MNIRLTDDQAHEVKQGLLLRIKHLRSIDLSSAPIKCARYIDEAIRDCEAIYKDLSEDGDEVLS